MKSRVPTKGFKPGDLIMPRGRRCYAAMFPAFGDERHVGMGDNDEVYEWKPRTVIGFVVVVVKPTPEYELANKGYSYDKLGVLIPGIGLLWTWHFAEDFKVVY